ncbi:hypothetical protein F4815DRAFT_42131 [Daldinia loculata]|uniref:uncharacterized protein n=1 Tax=Daldinia loculata TaxID=103429 RepID=UPI0020C26A99|nr:uncharacterized protein F4817DRAFT_314613 [Daldinia loculata]KAI1648654.1 hypothetical protein F4817DRAFT_314613 [Daldinia loculata]KAI2782477.1 hypothetical protein F4815DRAFT_42131 [Daldinia loculata]
MKATTILVSALAAVATAAPTAITTPEKRAIVDLGAFNNFGFANQDLQYLLAINQFDLQSFAQLAAFNNLNIGNFQGLFANNGFDINALLQLQQIALLSQLGGLGIFSNFDLSSIQLNVFDLGLIGGIGGFDISSLIDQSLVPQIQAIIQKTEISAVVIN